MSEVRKGFVDEDLKRLCAVLVETVSTGEVLRLIRRIKDRKMTVEVLRETGIGKHVRKTLIKHCDEEVKTIAKDILREWKNLVSKEMAHVKVASANASISKDIVFFTSCFSHKKQKRYDQDHLQLCRSKLMVEVSSILNGELNFKQLKIGQLRRIFESLDVHLLGGSLGRLLHHEGRILTWRLSNRMTSRAGQLLTHENAPRKHELGVSTFLLFQSFTGQQKHRKILVNGLECHNRAEALVRIIEHELVHLLQRFDFMSGQCACESAESIHGPKFQNLVKHLFGHKDWRHDLVTPSEIAHTKRGICIGCFVRFELPGEGTLVGKVNRVTKRVTVLVQEDLGACARHQDAREFSDGNFYRKVYVPIEDCMQVDGDTENKKGRGRTKREQSGSSGKRPKRQKRCKEPS